MSTSCQINKGQEVNKMFFNDKEPQRVDEGQVWSVNTYEYNKSTK